MKQTAQTDDSTKTGSDVWIVKTPSVVGTGGIDW